MELAFEISQETDGAFDVSLAPVMDRLRNEKGEIVMVDDDTLDEVFAVKRNGLYLLSPDEFTVHC